MKDLLIFKKVKKIGVLNVGGKMKIAWIGGSHPRHLYYANKINEQFPISYGIMQERESMTPESDDPVIKEHYISRKEAEERYFSSQICTWEPMFPCIKLKHEEISNVYLDADLILVFGCGMLNIGIDPLQQYRYTSDKMLNMHLGLSPRYKGSATNFWPFYMKEPEYVGVTFHLLSGKPDEGPILHQCVPAIEKKDNMHDIMCKAIIKGTEDAICLLKGYNIWSQSQAHFFKQKSLGKTWLKKDLKDVHIKALYPEPKSYLPLKSKPKIISNLG
jgi:methionyl-tRNA formyltransferase